jgi:hypothetical protein
LVNGAKRSGPGRAGQAAGKGTIKKISRSLKSSEPVAPNSLILALVARIQSAKVLEPRESLDPKDVGSLDPRHKGEDEGEWGIPLANKLFLGCCNQRKGGPRKAALMSFY